MKKIAVIFMLLLGACANTDSSGSPNLVDKNKKPLKDDRELCVQFDYYRDYQRFNVNEYYFLEVVDGIMKLKHINENPLSEQNIRNQTLEFTYCNVKVKLDEKYEVIYK